MGDYNFFKKLFKLSNSFGKYFKSAFKKLSISCYF